MAACDCRFIYWSEKVWISIVWVYLARMVGYYLQFNVSQGKVGLYLSRLSYSVGKRAARTIGRNAYSLRGRDSLEVPKFETRYIFLRVLQFSPLLKNQHFQIPIRSRNARPRLNEFFELLGAPWVNKLHYVYIYKMWNNRQAYVWILVSWNTCKLVAV